MKMKLEFVIGDCDANDHCPLSCPFLRWADAGRKGRVCHVYTTWTDVLSTGDLLPCRHPECVRQARRVEEP